MEHVRKMIDEAKTPIPIAIKAALAGQGYPKIEDFADMIGMRPDIVGKMLKGYWAPNERVLEGLTKTLGGSVFEWRRLLWQAGEPKPDEQQAAVV